MNMFSSILSIVLLLYFNSEIKCSSSEANLSPDSKSLYHDIVSGHGLYKGFAKVTELGGTNFKSIVFGEEKQKLWLVEFYNSWCGHCHRFAPVWKTFASTSHDWEAVKVGAVDCANDNNNQLCRDMEVMYYPMIKLYPPNSDEKFLGEDFSKGTVEEMLKALVLKLKSIHESAGNVTGIVNLKPANDTCIETLWNPYQDPTVQYVVLVFEPADLEVGSELALDLSKTQEVRVRLVNPTNEDLSRIVGIEKGVAIVERDFKFTVLNVLNFTRIVANHEVRKYLASKGVTIALELPQPDVDVGVEVDISKVMEVMQMEEEIKKKLQTKALANHMFQLDLETALQYMMNNEIPLHKSITGEPLVALSNMMQMCTEYFPWGHQGKIFLNKLKEKAVDGKQEVNGHTFREVLKELESLYKPFMSDLRYIECQGSQPGYRGYPCGLWKFFHTMTVYEKKGRGVLGAGALPRVIFVIRDYIKHFFSCSECSQHFAKMAETMEAEIKTQNDSIMWLWKAHNKVNNRLAGDETEDPKHPKVQFPSAEGCPACRTSNGSWNYSEVLAFLENMYGNIIYMDATDLTPSTTHSTHSEVTSSYAKSLRNEFYNDEKGYFNKQLNESSRSAWDFNVFDISLCVVLYVCSVAILILVCIKFIFKRSYRKKPYVHDVLSKV